MHKRLTVLAPLLAFALSASLTLAASGCGESAPPDYQEPNQEPLTSVQELAPVQASPGVQELVQEPPSCVTADEIMDAPFGSNPNLPATMAAGPPGFVFVLAVIVLPDGSPAIVPGAFPLDALPPPWGNYQP